MVWAGSQWRQVADLRAHGIEVAGKVVSVAHVGKVRKARLELPRPDGSTAEAEIDLWPLTRMAEGDLIEVTYDPAGLDRVQRGWGIDYASPIMVSLGAAALTVAAVAGVRSAATGRPVPSGRSRRNVPLRPRRRRKPVKRQKVKRRR
ncbi:hypothetical protein [Actinoplanes sp. NPDC051411]|uniref:hypothetical protein n=1 Tax=Actinoplanes sp. NPDC051411 TaxID=3155522 RepID=UPI003435F455